MKKRVMRPTRLRLIIGGVVVLLALIGGLGVALLGNGGSASQTSQAQNPTSATFKCNNTAMTAQQVAAYLHIEQDELQELKTKRQLDPAQVCALSADDREEAIKHLDDKDGSGGMEDPDAAENETPGEDGPDLLLEWEYGRQRDAKGVIDPNGLIRGVAQAKKLPVATGGALPRPRTGGVTNGSWTWIGPGNVGGRVRAMLVSSVNPNTLYVGGIAGGMWKSTDAGQTWSPLNDFLPNMSVQTLAFDPGDTTDNTIYAGTGEGYFNADSIRGAGIFKSTDAGAHWTQLANTANANFYYVNRLSIARAGGVSIVLAATQTGIFRSTDNGTNWTQVQTSPNPRGFYQVVFNPSDSSKAVAGGGLGIAFYSTDSGQSWTQITSPWATGSIYNRVELAYAPSSPNIVYASTGSASTTGSQLWKSTDGGQTYTQVTTNVNNALSGQSWYANTLAVDPTNASTVIWSGLDIYRSTNGGTTFTKISDWTQAPPNNTLSAHADHHLTLFPPNYNGTTVKRVYFTNDGGVFKTEDISTVAATSGWVNLNNNLGITQFYGGAGNPNGKIVAGAQDNGTQVYGGNPQGWVAMYGGDGGFAAADPNNPNLLYGEYVYLRIHRSTTGGTFNSSSNIISGLTEANDSANAAFIAPFILDPNNSGRMYGGANHLWVSNNITGTTPTWSQVPNLPTITSCNATSPRSCISAVAVAKGNPDVIWVGRANGLIYYTTNGTAASPNWTQVDANLPGGTPGRSINRIAIDPNNPNIVYVSLGGYVSGNLYKSTNNGAAGSWTDVTGTGTNKLPQVPIYSMTIHPYTSSWLYVGTPVGLFVSEDGGTNWEVTTQDGPTTAPVNELTWLGNTTTLLAVTHGRGVYKADVPSNVPILNALSAASTESNGNGNNVLEPGETAAITVTLRNSGSVTATVVNSTLSVVSGPATIVQGNSAYPDIAPNSNQINSTLYQVKINDNATCGDKIQLRQDVTYVGGRTTSYTFTISTGTASLGSNNHYAYTGSAVTVPDNNPTGVDVPINVATVGKAGHIKVTFSASMTYDGDLTFSLVAPSGKTVTLIAQRGDGGQNFTNTVLDDGAATPIGSGAAPFTGSFKPEEPLAGLTDESLNGTWKLHIVDGGGGDVASLTDFQLDIQPNVYSCQTSTNPVPTITALNPNSTIAGSTGFQLTIDGTGFVASSVVSWNNSVRATTFISSTRLTAAVLTSDLTNPGSATVQVFNPTPGGGTSNSANFTIAPVGSCTNPLSVTITADSGCGSLRYALQQADTGNVGLTITISPTLGGPIVVGSTLPDVKSGVSIVGSCGANGPTAQISGNGLAGSGLKLLGNNTLIGLKITGFGGPQLLVPAPTGGFNYLSCVVVSKP